MQKSNLFSKTLIENVVRYAAIILMLVVTPLLARPMAVLFDWAVLDWSREGTLREFWVEFFTAVFWLLEWAAFLLLEHFVVKKYRAQGETVEEVSETAETAVEAEAALTELAQTEKKKRKFSFTWTKRDILPSLNVAILFAIAAACILLVTLQIGFYVKPFWELGNKATKSSLIIKCGEIARNLVKCIWIVAALKTSLRIAEELFENIQVEETLKKWLIWLGVGVLCLLLGVCDLLVFTNAFWWTYLLFYVAFTAIYFFTEQAPIKSFLLILFIYIF